MDDMFRDVPLNEKERLEQIKMEQKARIKAEKTMDKEKRKQERQSNMPPSNKRVYITAISILSILLVLVATAFFIVYFMPSENDKMVESSYKKSFYDTIEQVDNIDLNLSKAIVTTDNVALSNFMLDTAVQSEVCENDINNLPLEDQNRYYTTKVINQIGDFAKYINKKIVNGEEITANDKTILQALYEANAKLKEYLQSLISSMGEDYSFSNIEDENDILLSTFNELQNLSVEYPQLIYDGPFSDGADRKEIKGLSGNTILEDEAVNIFTDIFQNYNVKNIVSTGESDGNIVCYNVEGIKEGSSLYAQITKVGGKLLAFAYAGSCKETIIGYEEAEKQAQDFILSQGITNLKPVWYNLSNNVYTINFVFEQDDIIIYSDMVKVRVCAETGLVIGFESSSYYTNHTSRSIEQATKTQEEAQKNVSENIAVESCRLVIVPIGTNSESLCYEFSGTYEEQTFYVYIDAITGKQVQMFKVIESTEGTLLM